MNAIVTDIDYISQNKHSNKKKLPPFISSLAQWITRELNECLSFFLPIKLAFRVINLDTLMYDNKVMVLFRPLMNNTHVQYM